MDGSVHFENQALHHSCRPVEFEMMSLKDFSERLEVKIAAKKSMKAENPVMLFMVESATFKHPSRKETVKDSGTHQCRQGARHREERKLAKIVQWQWQTSGATS